MSLFFSAGSPTTEMSPADLRTDIFTALERLGSRKKVLAVPPDFTRFHSQAGALTELMANPKLCQRMGAEGRRRVEELFAWEAIAAQTVALYRGLVERKIEP